MSIKDINQNNVEAYREKVAELLRSRASKDHTDAREDQLLADLDEIWFHLTEEERALVNDDEPKEAG